ncbi:CinA family nicotinamide mononucleotide deamidase-related protein [Compostibacter hankyongensis]|uniref:CinA-like protein n=1 Tax=Compostibacter hankyongensis TaxID=1007089 RepID=A0ABP8G2L8_9BACT
MEKTEATIITIGDELLIGQTIDTNSAWMATRLNEAGIWLRRRVAVGDSREDILQALREESAKVPLILITGGLGPTADDITKDVLCEYFDTRLVWNEAALQRVTQLLQRRGLPMLERNRQQALLPEACTPVPNERGSAPGMWFEKDGVVYVSMPGVPYEMQGMMEATVLPRLHTRFHTPAILHRTLLTSGMGESFVAERLADFEKGLFAIPPPVSIKLAYLPDFALLKLRLTAIGPVPADTEAVLERQFGQLQALLPDITVATADITLEALLGQLLLRNGRTLGTAESCTGGYIAHRITSVPGSSAYFKGSVVSYVNAVKQEVLKVGADTLQQHGAVSEAVVREMVTGALALLHTDYAIAVSGILGPGGGTPEKPVGTVWVAAGSRDRTLAKSYHLRHDRQRNTAMAASYAMNLLRTLLETGEAL